VFVEVLMGRGRLQASKDLLERVSKGEEDAVASHFSIHSIEVLMSRSGLDIGTFLRNIEQSAGLIVYETSVSEEAAASVLMKEFGMDFGDALQYYVAKKLGAKEIVSYDMDFEGLDIPRVEPKEGP
jgi:predicted nucleic acid-binding protein